MTFRIPGRFREDTGGFEHREKPDRDEYADLARNPATTVMSPLDRQMSTDIATVNADILRRHEDWY